MPTWENLNPATATFTVTSMLMPYKGAWTKQFSQKIVKNTGFNWNWNRPVCINRSNFISSGDIKRYDSGRDYRNKHIFAIFTNIASGVDDPGVIATNGWWWDPSLSPGGSPTDIHRFQLWGLKLTTSWYDLYKGTGYPPFSIRANTSGTGFEIRADASTNYLWGFIFRIEDNMVDEGIPVV